MAISLAPSHLIRYKDVIYLLLKYGRSDVVKSSEFDDLFSESDHAALAAAKPKADELARDLEKMGPTFIKVGQLLSTRPDLLPVPFIEALSRLQDKVEPFPFEQVEQIITSELGVRLSRAFHTIDPTPIAAASLGQVHRATLRDGREVAIKVQRPHIRERMVEDLDSLDEVAEFLDHHTSLGQRYEFQRMLNEFRKSLLNELDYRQEAQNLLTLHHNLKSFDRLVVPLPVDDYSSSKVLTMDFIEGQKLTALSPLIRTEIDGAALGEQLFAAYLKQILVDGFFHADPHPGNILLTQDSKLAIIDLGMVARVSPSLQDGLLRILLAVSEGRGEDAAQTVISMSTKKEDFDEPAFTRNVVEVVARHKEMSLHNIAVGKVVMELSRMASDAGVRTPSEFTTLGKTLLNLDQIGDRLNPDFNANEAIRRHASSIMRQRLTSNLTPGNLFTGMLDAQEFLHKLPGRVNKILDTVANNELKLNVDAIDEDKLMAGFQKVANRITVGLVLAALIIGAAILAHIDTPFKLLGYPILATVLFLAATAGAILLTTQIMFSDRKN